MKTVKEVKANVDQLIDENWLWFDPDPDEDVEIIRITPANIKQAANLYNIPEPFLAMLDYALRTMANEIVRELHEDLEDIWKKLEEL